MTCPKEKNTKITRRRFIKVTGTIIVVAAAHAMMFARIRQAERFLPPIKTMKVSSRVENAICVPIPLFTGMKLVEDLMGNKLVWKYALWEPSSLQKKSPSKKEMMGTK